MQDVPSWQECKTICTHGLGGGWRMEGERLVEVKRRTGGAREERGDLRTGGWLSVGGVI